MQEVRKAEAEKVYEAMQSKTRPGGYIDRADIVAVIAQALTAAKRDAYEDCAQIVFDSGVVIGHGQPITDDTTDRAIEAIRSRAVEVCG